MNKLNYILLLSYLSYYCDCGILLNISILVSAALDQNEETCYTPDKTLGQCVEVRKCSQVTNSMHHKQLSAEDADYLKKSHCGFEGSEPKICCTVEGENKFFWKPPLAGIAHIHLLPDTNTCGLQPYTMNRGSTHASIKEFPWLALLQYEKPHGHEFNCGGTLINKRYVLTSAHCVERIPEAWKLIKVRLGEYNLNTSRDCYHDPNHGNLEHCSEAPIDLRVAEKIVHEHYNPNDLTQPNDIALLRLNKDVVFTDFIRPICLPKHEGFLNNGNSDGKMTVAGWGIISETRSHSHVKLKSRVPLMPYRECASIYNTIHVDLHGQLCADQQDFCTVDSGGPLMIHNSSSSGFNWYIAGLKSYGPTPCGNNNWPDVYTRVINYVDWIVRHLKP